MQNDQNFLVQNLLPPSSPTAAVEPSRTGPVDLFQVQIEQLFVRFQSNYGHLWSSQFQTEEMSQAVKAEWCSALSEFTPDRIRKVAEYCFEYRGMPPTLPDFKKLCRPQMKEFGLLPMEEAYQEACLNAHQPNQSGLKWSHPAVFLAGKQVGWHDLHCHLSGVQNRFEKAYKHLCRQVMSGVQLEMPEPNSRALEHSGGMKTRTVQEKQTAEFWLSKMKSSLGSRSAKTSATGGTHGSM